MRWVVQQLAGLLALLALGNALRAQDAAVGEDAAPDAAAVDAAAVDAVAQDAAAAIDAAGSGCGSLTFLGECVGDVVRYCSAGQVRSVDCSNPAEYARGGPLVTCGLLDCTVTGCQGYWCVAKPGTSCAALSCDVELGMGCLGGLCSVSTVCDPEVYEPSCEGPLLTYCAYTVGNLDCSEGGAQPRTCDLGDPDRDPCVGEQGASCNLTLGRVCAEPLECVAGTCAHTGDAGAVDADAGGVEPDDAGTARDAATGRGDDGAPADCVCRGGAPQLATLAPALLALLGWQRRRRSPR